MRKKLLKSIFFSSFLTVFLCFVVISLAFSWFKRENSSTFHFQSGEYDVSIEAALNDVIINENSPFYDSSKQAIILDGGKQTSANYLDKLDVSLIITVAHSSRFRIKVQDEWQLKRTYYESGFSITEAVYFQDAETIPGNEHYPFTILNISNFIYDSDSGYLYYSSVLEKDQTYVIDFISGGVPQYVRSTADYYEECTVFLDFSLDVVQANRFSEVWGISINFFG
jgi:hypothetical protein